MGDVDPTPGPFSDLDRLADPLQDPLLVTDMSRVDAVVFGDHLAGFDQFVGRGVALHDVVEPGRDAHGPLLHPPMHLPADHLHLQIVDPLLAESAGQRTDICVGDVAGDVLCRRPIEFGQELTNRFPTPVLLESQRIQTSEIEQPLSRGVGSDGSVRDAVEHQDFGGETLRGLGQKVRPFQEPAVGVVVDIDEAGRHDPAADIDPPGCFGVGEVTDRGDPVAGDADVGGVPVRAGAVDDRAAAENEIVHGGRVQLYDWVVGMMTSSGTLARAGSRTTIITASAQSSGCRILARCSALTGTGRFSRIGVSTSPG